MPIYNTNIPTQIDNDLTPSTTQGASKTAINAGLSGVQAAAAADATTKANAAEANAIAASQPLDIDLTQIAAILPSNDDIIQRKAGSWVRRTMAQLWADLKSNADALYVSLAGSYGNPSWITGLAWLKITGTPTTLSGYGITDAAPLNSQLKATAVKSGSYTAAAGDYVPVDTTSGVINITLPTAPADGTVIGIKRVIGASNNVTYTCGGSDVLNVAGGSTSGSLQILNQQVTLIYRATGGIWYVETSLSITGITGMFKPIWSPLNMVSVATLTGTTNETVLTTTGLDLVGKIASGDMLYISFGAQGTSSVNNKTFRVYISDSPSSLVNSVNIGMAIGTNNIANTVDTVKYMCMTGLATQNVVGGNAIGQASPGASMGTTTINFGVGAKYIVITGQLQNSGETLKLQWVRTQINR